MTTPSTGSFERPKNLCQSLGELRRQRILVRNSFGSSETLSSLTFPSDQLQLETRIKEFVREEVARQLSLMPLAERPSSGLPSALQTTIREQVAEALPHANIVTAALTAPQVATVAAPLTHAAPIAMPMTYAECAAQPVKPPFRSFLPAIPAMVPAISKPVAQFPPTMPAAVQYANPWRTQDNRRICFSCGYAGHVARYCHRVAPSAQVKQTSAYMPRPAHLRVPSGPPPTSFSANRQMFESRRSPSPRRRSLSPMRRHLAPTHEGNEFAQFLGHELRTWRNAEGLTYLPKLLLTC